MALLLASWWRIVEPLLQGGLAGDWRTMPQHELRAFVDAGIARERILLGPVNPVGALPSGSRALQLAIARLPSKALDPKANIPADPREVYRLELEKKRRRQGGR